MHLTHTMKSVLVVAGLAALGGCSSGSSEPEAAAASEGGEATPPETGTPTDGQILGILAAIDTGEIKQAQVALTQANDPRVKEFAQHMIEQHSQAKQKGAELAQQQSLTPASSETSNELETKGGQLLTTLNETKDATFDSTYMKAQIQQHQEGLDLIRNKLMPAAKNDALSAQLKTTANMVQSHLTEAQQIMPTLNTAAPATTQTNPPTQAMPPTAATPTAPPATPMPATR
jgi:putative membrane protein